MLPVDCANTLVCIQHTTEDYICACLCLYVKVCFSVSSYIYCVSISKLYPFQEKCF